MRWIIFLNSSILINEWKEIKCELMKQNKNNNNNNKTGNWRVCLLGMSQSQSHRAVGGGGGRSFPWLLYLLLFWVSVWCDPSHSHAPNFLTFFYFFTVHLFIHITLFAFVFWGKIHIQVSHFLFNYNKPFKHVTYNMIVSNKFVDDIIYIRMP